LVISSTTISGSVADQDLELLQDHGRQLEVDLDGLLLLAGDVPQDQVLVDLLPDDAAEPLFAEHDDGGHAGLVQGHQLANHVLLTQRAVELESLPSASEYQPKCSRALVRIAMA
jgi:hypothetical protein